MFYLIHYSYEPGTAAMNRILGYLKALSNEEIETTMVFIYPGTRRKVEEEELPHIHYSYLYQEYFYSSYKFIGVFLRKIYPIKFSKGLKHGDIVYLYGCPQFMHYLLKKKGIRIYYETTEHPEGVPQGNPFTRFPLRKHYEDVCKIDGFFGISTCLRDFFISKGVSPDKAHIINMTVDSSRFEGLTKTVKERYIAYCGVIYNKKDGVDQLIKSFASTAKSHPDVKLYIIGPVLEKGDRNVNIQLIEYLGLKDRVVLTGKISAKQMPQLLKNAEICALDRPDGLRAKAGFPTKLGEYLLSGNPVVITGVGDIPLFLQDGESALIARPDDQSSFAEKLNWALDNPDKARDIGKKGAEIALKYFNSEIETKKIINVIFGKRK